MTTFYLGSQSVIKRPLDSMLDIKPRPRLSMKSPVVGMLNRRLKND